MTDQRIENLDNPSGKAAELFEKIEGKMGAVPNIFKIFGHAPAALEGYLNFSGALGEGALDAKLRERIALTVAGYNGCDYCASAHTKIGSGAGLEESEMEKNLSGQSNDEKAQAGLDFALAVLKQQGRVSDSDFKAAIDAGYSKEEIIEIVANVALNVYTNYFNEAFKTDVDFPKVETQKSAKAA